MVRPARMFRDARAALDRGAWSLCWLRARVRAEAVAWPLRRRLLMCEALHDLEREWARVAECHLRMVMAGEQELSRAWRNFLAGYDAFLAAERAARRLLAGRSRDAVFGAATMARRNPLGGARKQAPTAPVRG